MPVHYDSPSRLPELRRASEHGELQPLRVGETRMGANARILRDIGRAGMPMPPPGTPLGDWLHEWLPTKPKDRDMDWWLDSLTD